MMPTMKNNKNKPLTLKDFEFVLLCEDPHGNIRQVNIKSETLRTFMKVAVGKFEVLDSILYGVTLEKNKLKT